MTFAGFSTWNHVIKCLEAYPTGTILRVPKGHLPHPRMFAMTESLGLPEGQSADYRRVLAGGRGLHVKDFLTHYEAHLDAVHPSVDLHEHVRRDAPRTYVAGGAALGALVGSALGKSKESALVGAAIGGLVAALLAQENQARTPGGVL